MTAETLIRIEGNAYEDGNIKLTAYHYPIVKRTRCGVWIELWRGGKRKFVNLERIKKWASPTMEEARDAFYRRKSRQMTILSRQFDLCERVLEAFTAKATIQEIKL